MKTSGQVIKDIRKDFGLTQEKMVEGLNLYSLFEEYNQVTLSRYENEVCHDNPYRLEYIRAHAEYGSWQWRYGFEGLEALQ